MQQTQKPFRSFLRRAAGLIAVVACVGGPAQPQGTVSVRIDSPADGATVSGIVTVAGVSSGLVSGRVSVSIDGGPFRLAQGITSWTFAWDTSQVPAGAHTITARAREPMGATATDTINVTVGAPTGLAVAITNPLNGATISQTLTMTGTSNAATLVDVSADGGPFQVANGLNPWNVVFETGSLAPGPHTLVARASDGQNTVTASVSITVGPPTPGSQQFTYLSSVDGEAMTSKLWVPAGFDPNGPALPLLVHLHGGGGTGNFNSTIAAELDARTWLGVAPDGRNWGLATNQGCGWKTSAAYVNNPQDPDVGPGEQDIFDAIDWVVANYPVDQDRIYLTGFSMGGRGTYMIGLKNPDRFAAIVPQGPAIDMIEIYTRRPEPCACKEGMVSGAPGDSPFVDTMYKITSGRFLIENAYNLPVFHGHGTLDTVASNTPSNAPFLHGRHITTDPSFSGDHVTIPGWSNTCFTGNPASLPLSFGFGHTPTLAELAAAFPGAYDWAYMFTPVAHVPDPKWALGTVPGPDDEGVPDPDDPTRLLGFFDFLAARSLVHSPDTVVYKTYTDEHRRAYWARLDSATPWLDAPAAIRARRDQAGNRLDVELIRAARATIDLDLAGLSLPRDGLLTVTLQPLVEPSYAPDLAAPGEPLAPILELDTDLSGAAAVSVLLDGAPLAPSLVTLTPGSVSVGPLDLIAAGKPVGLELIACSGWFTPFGAGSAGSGGATPRLDFSGCPAPGELVRFDVSNGLGGASGFLALGMGRGSLLLPGGTEILVAPVNRLSLVPIVLGGAGPGAGATSIPFALPPGLGPVDLTAQAALFDPVATDGLATTAAVQVRIQ